MLQKHQRFAQKKPPQNKQKILPNTTECTFDLFFFCLSGGINSKYSYEDKRNSQKQNKTKKKTKYFIQTFIPLLPKIGIYKKKKTIFICFQTWHFYKYITRFSSFTSTILPVCWSGKAKRQQLIPEGVILRDGLCS